MILELINVEKKFIQAGHSVSVLNQLNFKVEKPERVAILGPSGSGKTTLLTLITGLDTPDQGQVLFLNQDITKLNERDRTRFRALNVGIVFQQYHLINYLSAFENIALPLELLGEKDIDARVDTALNAVGLSHRSNHYPHQLSGGECQRVAIARALVVKPKLLIADEPTGSLDEKTGLQVMEYLFSSAKDNNTTLLLITHNLELAKKCDRILSLKDGKLF